MLTLLRTFTQQFVPWMILTAVILLLSGCHACAPRKGAVPPEPLLSRPATWYLLSEEPVERTLDQFLRDSQETLIQLNSLQGWAKKQSEVE